MMKNFFVLIAFVTAFTIQGVFAQTEQGKWLAGGSFNLVFPTDDDNPKTILGINPTVGYFLIDNLALGTGLPIGISSGENVSSSSIGLAPFGRYYFELDNIRPFFELGFSVLRYRLKSEGAPFDDTISTDTEVSAGFGAGAAYFLSERVALEGILEYTGEDYRQFGNRSAVRFRIGFQLYFP